MYCDKCGCKVGNEDSMCPECGAELKDIEYNGGFWGLVGIDLGTVSDNRKKVADEKTEPLEQDSLLVKDEPLQGVNEKLSKICTNSTHEKYGINSIVLDNTKPNKYEIKQKNKRSMYFLLSIIIVLALVCVIQTVRLGMASRKLEKVQGSITELELENSVLSGDNESLKQENNYPNQKKGELGTQIDISTGTESFFESKRSDTDNVIGDETESLETESLHSDA